MKNKIISIVIFSFGVFSLLILPSTNLLNILLFVPILGLSIYFFKKEGKEKK